MSKVILLINPLVAAKYISEQLKSAGFFSIALFTTAYDKILAYSRPNPNWFDKQIYFTQSIDQLISTVSSYPIDFIINGDDESLSITENLIKQLLPQYSNEENTAFVRTNKFYMQEALKEQGLPYINQIKVASKDNDNFLIQKTKKIGFPCFIKPVLGVGSIGASFCYTYQNLKEKLNSKIYTPTNKLMDEYIIQEIIQGQEIFVDVFSVNGTHYVSSVQTITKEEIHHISCYRTEYLIYNPALWLKSVNIVKKALDACGFRSGFTHTELFYLEDGSFRIIEINPRHSGAKGLPNILAKYHGLNTQIDLLASYLNNKKIKESITDMIKGYGELLYLYNFSQQPTSDISPHIVSFQSVKEVILASQIGAIPPKVKNLGNVDYILLLYDAHNKMQVLKESDKLRKLESRWSKLT